MNGATYKPQYSYARMLATKITAFITIIDDIFDTYGTTEESMQLKAAIDRYKLPSLLQLINACHANINPMEPRHCPGQIFHNIDLNEKCIIVIEVTLLK